MKLGMSWVILVALALAIGSCTKETEEDRVRKVVTAVQKAAEEKKILAVQEHLSRSYGDPKGHDLDGIKALLAFYFFRHKTVAVYIPAIEASVNGPQATAKFQAILTAKGIDGESANIILPDALGAYDFEVSFRKEEGEWKVLSANWERALEGGAGQ